MYCILITGIPASGKTGMARFLSGRLGIPYVSKDELKELLFDELGFSSRAEKVKLGTTAMKLMYDFADRLLAQGLSVILENNFENSSREGLEELLKKHSCRAVTVRLTGEKRKLYERFLERENAPDRHMGHVVNDCYPPLPGKQIVRKPLSFEDFQAGIAARGMDSFAADGPCLVLDTTDWEKVDREAAAEEITRLAEREGEAADG